MLINQITRATNSTKSLLPMQDSIFFFFFFYSFSFTQISSKPKSQFATRQSTLLWFCQT